MYTVKKIALALMCIFIAQSASAFSVHSLFKVIGIVATTGLLTAVRAEHPLAKAILFPITFKVKAENTQRIIDLNVQFNLVPLIAGYWALKKL